MQRRFLLTIIIVYLFLPTTAFNQEVTGIDVDTAYKKNPFFTFEINALAIGFGTFNLSSIQTSIPEEEWVFNGYSNSSFGFNFLEGRVFLKDKIGVHVGLGFYQSVLDRQHVRDNFSSTLPGYEMEFAPIEEDDPGPIFGSIDIASFDIGLVGKFNIRQVSILPTVNYQFCSKSGSAYLETYYTNSTSGDSFYRAYDFTDDVMKAIKLGLEMRFNFYGGAYLGLRSSYGDYQFEGDTRIWDKHNDGSIVETYTSHSFKAAVWMFQAFIGLSTKRGYQD